MCVFYVCVFFSFNVLFFFLCLTNRHACGTFLFFHPCCLCWVCALSPETKKSSDHHFSCGVFYFLSGPGSVEGSFSAALMGKGRDKRKKREDPSKALRRACRQAQKRSKGAQQEVEDADVAGGLNNEEAPEVTLGRIRKQEGKMRTTVKEENILPPSPRGNVVFTQHPERDNELLVFGGEYWDGEKTVAYNDLYSYNIKRDTWSRFVLPVKPAPRSSSQGVLYKHYFIIFGGEFVSQSQSQFLHFRDTWRFDTRKLEWEEVKVLKGGPSSRSGHRMCMWRRSAVLFGGFYDNAQECHYLNDLWLLSHLDGTGVWTAVKTAPHGELPHPRSGHCMAVHNDTLFVYGGFSTEKFNRFEKTQATVHHDLWMIRLPQDAAVTDGGAAEGSLPLWTKLRLGGIPPPIRCGVSSAFKDKRMYLFGGVMDIESPGGKVVSSFANDLFVFHMDAKRFYPVVLRQKRTAAVVDSTRGDLSAELKALRLQHLDDETALNEDDDDDNGDDDDSTFRNSLHDVSEVKASFEVNKRGQIYPYPRMNAATLVVGNTLYVFGGQFECGAREVTMSDLFALNLNTCDTYRVLLSQDISSTVWLGREVEVSDAGSWESGSTVVTAAYDFDDDDDDASVADDGELAAGVESGRNPPELVDGDDDSEPPQVIPAELDTDVTPGRDVVDGITTVRGKKGLKVHKEQLLAQLGSNSSVPTPDRDENRADFFLRTKSFWISMATESLEGACEANQVSERQVHTQATHFANRRHREVMKLLEQLRVVEEYEKEEARFFRERRERKAKEWEAYERELEEMEEVEADDGNENVEKHI